MTQAAPTRWTPGRKMALVRSLRRKDITFAEACETFDLSAEELQGWVDGANAHGLNGLSVIRIQTIRTTTQSSEEITA